MTREPTTSSRTPSLRLSQKMGWPRGNSRNTTIITSESDSSKKSPTRRHRPETVDTGVEPVPLGAIERADADAAQIQPERKQDATTSITTNIRPGAIAVAGPGTSSYEASRAEVSAVATTAETELEAQPEALLAATLVTEDDSNHAPVYEAIKLDGVVLNHKSKQLRAALGLLVIVVVGAIVGGVVASRQQQTPANAADETEESALSSISPPAPTKVPATVPTNDPTNIDGRGSCTDTNSSCRERSSLGECWSFPDYMLEKCKRSCFLCIDEDTDYEFRISHSSGALGNTEGYCVNVPDSRAENFDSLQLHSCNGSDAQKFRFDGEGRLYSKLHPIFCVEMDPDYGVFLHSACYDHWEIIAVYNSYEVKVKNIEDNMCLSADWASNSGGPQNGTPIKRGTCGSAYAPNSKFTINW